MNRLTRRRQWKVQLAPAWESESLRLAQPPLAFLLSDPVAAHGGHAVTNLTPFANDAALIGIGKLTIENGSDRLALYGSLDITLDKLRCRSA